MDGGDLAMMGAGDCAPSFVRPVSAAASHVSQKGPFGR
jgi:hypothetical protein